MQRFERRRTQRERLREDFLSHKPTTGIIEKIKAATPKQGLLLNVPITPDIARDLLTLNTDNRPADLNTISRYASFMREGQWVYVGDVIRITKSMKLIDAQQRLLALIETGVTLSMHIQTGLDDDAFGVIDSGRTRSGADALAIAGHKDVNVLSAAIRAEIYFRTQGRHSARISQGAVYPVQIMEWTKTQDLPLMVSCVEEAVKVLHVKGKFIAQSTWAFLYYTFQRIRGAKTDAHFFVHALASGESLSRTDHTSVIYLLREKLIQLRTERSTNTLNNAKILRDLHIRYILTAWNLYREKQVVKMLKVDTKEVDLPKPK